ncbi:DUF333 domain-containing protein [Entomomonas moraniae]|uniref:DUF333 domain-containing protein n=2 Tax=Entomomonas moraniae TaxID=2213226 RepID=A0A3Q9JM69_9GAMM|nr:DUF333 domain-containing protein [Entomomonas moraniae]AZS50430.1 DUF333 domain-containing protein [Entomomonas moraniae]
MKKIVFLFATTLILVGCNSMDNQSKKDKNPSVGMANPASVYCEQIGGKLEIKNSTDGQYGMCTLPNGEQIEEWALYRRDHK